VEELLVVRADAGERVGMGHIGRCYALASAWREAGGRALFVMAQPGVAVTEWMEHRSLELVEINATAASDADALALRRAVDARGASAVVVDGYAFGAGYLSAVRDAAPLVVIDDQALLEKYDADVVVNQNLHASDELYSQRASGARLLLGPRFALIRPEFRERSSGTRRFPPRAETCLVTFGGSDAGNATGEALRTLDGLGAGLAVRAVAGVANPNVDQLRAEVQAFPGAELLIDVDDMAEHMAWADVAVSSAGSTSWELAAMGVPSVLVPLAPNQEPVAAGLERQGAAARATMASLGDAFCSMVDDVARRQACSEAGRRLVDGEGARRVVDVVRSVMR
jgi:UDP-2,4-diacetamido-2,4,6-trideoxy-beta-L-altropyranose hydrolase